MPLTVSIHPRAGASQPKFSYVDQFNKDLPQVVREIKLEQGIYNTKENVWYPMHTIGSIHVSHDLPGEDS